MSVQRNSQAAGPIQTLTQADSDEYRALLLRGVQEHPESFRISPDDVRRDPLPFSSDNPDDFTLGVFFDTAHLVGIVSFAREKRAKMRRA